MNDQLDCIVCGSCVVDMLCRPVDLERPIGKGVLHHADPVVLTGGGITINAGITMARLGMNIGVLSYVGDDAWGRVLRDLFRQEQVRDDWLTVHPSGATSTTVVAVDESGERSFFHCVGAPQLLDGRTILDQIDLLCQNRMLLLGYYSIMPNLEPELPNVFSQVRQGGCITAMDTAGDGGTMKPLDKILPHLDVYVPSFGEARHQTGHEDPEQIISAYRNCGAPGLLGVKLGLDGVLLGKADHSLVHIPALQAPNKVVDTTGAGDCFYAGLLTGLLKGLTVEDAGKLGVAAAAWSVTSVGGSTGGQDYAATARLAGLAD